MVSVCGLYLSSHKYEFIDKISKLMGVSEQAFPGFLLVKSFFFDPVYLIKVTP